MESRDAGCYRLRDAKVAMAEMSCRRQDAWVAMAETSCRLQDVWVAMAEMSCRHQDVCLVVRSKDVTAKDGTGMGATWRAGSSMMDATDSSRGFDRYHHVTCHHRGTFRHLVRRLRGPHEPAQGLPPWTRRAMQSAQLSTS